MAWGTWTCVTGIWPRNSTLNHVKSCNRSHSHTLIVVGGREGKVKLFNYPVPRWAIAAQEYTGHSTYVLSVRFCHDDQRIVSSGGIKDNSVIVWKVHECDCEQCNVKRKRDITSYV